MLGGMNIVPPANPNANMENGGDYRRVQEPRVANTGPFQG